MTANVKKKKKTLKIDLSHPICNSTFTFSHLLDVFIQSDLQMRTMEAISHHRTQSNFYLSTTHIYIYIYIYTILSKVLGHPLLMKGLTTSVIFMSTNLNV